MTTNVDSGAPDVGVEIERLISMGASSKDLLLILSDIDGALFASPSDKEKRGLRFLRNAIERVKGRICGIEFIRTHGEGVSAQRKALAVAAALDFLGTLGAATVAVLVVQIGLENVCSGEWERYVK